MIEKIRQAQLSGRILPDVVVDYDKVQTLNPLEVIVAIAPPMEKLLKGDTISYGAIINDDIKKSISISHVKDFDPDYYIVRITTHDGTLMFVYEMYERVFKDIIQGTAYCIAKPHDIEDDIDYTIGDLFYFSDFGTKEINGHKMMGQTDVMVLPVKTN